MAKKSEQDTGRDSSYKMPKAVGDKHPLADEVREALANNTPMPEGNYTINFGRGDAWLMDADDDEEMREAGYAPGSFFPGSAAGGVAAGGTIFDEDTETGVMADSGDNNASIGGGGGGTRIGRGAGSQAAGAGTSGGGSSR